MLDNELGPPFSYSYSLFFFLKTFSCNSSIFCPLPLAAHTFSSLFPCPLFSLLDMVPPFPMCLVCVFPMSILSSLALGAAGRTCWKNRSTIYHDDPGDMLPAGNRSLPCGKAVAAIIPPFSSSLWPCCEIILCQYGKGRRWPSSMVPRKLYIYGMDALVATSLANHPRLL
jgi:hypothetical protein